MAKKTTNSGLQKSEKPKKAEIENVAAEKLTEAVKDQLPDEVQAFLQASSGISEENPLDSKIIDKIFVGNPGIARDLRESGIAHVRGHNGQAVVLGAGFNTQGQLVTTAAAVPRNPGRSETYLGEVADFSASTTDRVTLLDLYDRIYEREGLINNAVNKASALVATQGEFKVRYVKGQRGISGDTKAEELKLLLKFWQEKVNARSEEGAITGDRGVTNIISQGTRLALKQGDHFARTNWTNVKVSTLKGKSFSLPMNVQTFDGRTIEIPEGLEGTGIDLFYWVPSSDFINTLRNPRDPNITQYLDKVIPSDVKSALLKDGKFLLDPALMIHIKHRGTPTSNYGESIITAAMNEVAYKRALQALDIVTIENLINRLVIILIGSDDNESVYHKSEVSSARMTMMSNMLRRVGPAATIIWPGPDVDVKEVGAHNAILSMDERYAQAENRIRNALGVPSALLSGDTDAGKAAGWAAVIGIAAELEEIRDQYKQVLTVIAERIALENGYEDVDVVWEFNQELLNNKAEHVEMVNKAFQGGALSFPTYIEEIGFDFDTELVRMQEDVDNDRRDELFGAPRAFVTQNNLGGESPEGQDGRPPGGRDPRTDTETTSPEENK